MGADGQARGDRLPRARILALALGVTITVVAWGVLVFTAIDFGRDARSDGQGGDWAFLGLATVGAVACMFLAILLGARLVALLRGAPPSPGEPRPQAHSHAHSHAQTHRTAGTPRPKGSPAGGKRAAR